MSEKAETELIEDKLDLGLKVVSEMEKDTTVSTVWGEI